DRPRSPVPRKMAKYWRFSAVCPKINVCVFRRGGYYPVVIDLNVSQGTGDRGRSPLPDRPSGRRVAFF
ncbi:MAG: hypothetical protein FWG68_06340, partial [Defluviitaleaceae bacterium]|nr:hypothetical protein [Defluviitaleaceae bacterium]